MENCYGSRCATIIVNQESLEHLANSNGVFAFEFGDMIESGDSAPQGEISQDELMDDMDKEKDKEDLLTTSTQIHTRSRASSSSTGSDMPSVEDGKKRSEN